MRRRSFIATALVIAAFWLTSCNSFLFKSSLSEILGVKEIQVSDSDSYDEWGGLQGEGYVLEIYELSESTVEQFLKQADKRLIEKADDRWRKQNWAETPFDTINYNEIQIMAFNYSSSNKSLMLQIEHIKNAINKEGVYHAFYYRPNKDVEEYIEAIQFFVLDVNAKRLYAIDCVI